jgi:phage recombination protein Bet
MEKVLNFTKEQKSLIWQRFVAPANGTEVEAKQFIEVCESFGLNPLLGDIIFQKYETKLGPRVNFITTRDGLLRVASNNPDYVGPPIANVVREGDDFEFIPSEGTVKHKFGKKRGNILGAYAILHHKRFRPVAVFVDFDEYYKANAASQNGKSPIWDNMPSAMIQKVAEVFVLRRQFPLGGLQTAEELGLGIDNVGEVINEPASGLKTDEDSQQKNAQPKDDTKQKEKMKVQSPVTPATDEEIKESETPSKKNPVSKHFTLKNYETGVSPSGVPYAKMQVIDHQNQKPILVLAKDEEAVKLSKSIPSDEPFAMEYDEVNGFNFLKTVNGISASELGASAS